MNAADIFLKVAGGFSSRGYVYGLGSATSTFYEKPAKPSSSATSRRVLESEVNILRDELKQQQEVNVRLQQRLEQQQEEMNDVKQEVQELRDVKQQLAQLIQMMSGCNPSADFGARQKRPPSPPPPPAVS